MKKNLVIHLQVQQGVLGKEGKIVGKADWKEIQEITLPEMWSKNVFDYTNDGLRFIWDGEARYKEKIDFLTNDLVYSLTYTRNTVFLDDLQVDPDNFVTGLRFRDYDDSLLFEIRQTPFDFDSGTLNVANSKWISNKNRRNER